MGHLFKSTMFHIGAASTAALHGIKFLECHIRRVKRSALNLFLDNGMRCYVYPACYTSQSYERYMKWPRGQEALSETFAAKHASPLPDIKDVSSMIRTLVVRHQEERGSVSGASHLSLTEFVRTLATQQPS
jgi:hypothetical protein